MVDTSKLDYQQLRVFDTLLDECSVTKTAKRLALTQPSVSAVLKKLRAQFDDPLFVRTQRGVTPTVKAESMAIEIREILDRMEALGADPEFDPHTESRRFSVVARDFSQVVIIAPLVRRLARDFPRVQLAVHAMPMAEAVDRMAGATVDLSISSLRYAPPHLQRHLVLEEPYYCVVDPASRLARKKSLTADDLQSNGHVSASAMSLVVGDPVTDLFAAADIVRDVKIAVDGYVLVPQMLQGTDYIAVIPESLVRCSSFPLKAYPMPIRFPRLQIALLWNQRVENEPGNKWLRELLIELGAEREAGLAPIL